MRIFHICDIANQSNGIYSVLKPLTAVQRDLGHKISIFNVHNPYVEDADFIPSSSSELSNFIMNEKPDLVIFHGVFYWPIVPISRLLWELNIPYLIELHGALSVMNMQKSPMKKTLFCKLYLNKIIKKAHSIIYLNHQEYCNSSIRSINPSCIVIPNGCTIHQDNTPSKQNKRVEILFLSRIDLNHKGLDALIRGLWLLKETVDSKSFHLSIYGKGSHKEQQWIKSEVSKLGSIADYCGAVYGDEKVKVFQNSDIFILTSRYEGFPMSILEALSFGLPCIVTPMTNVADIITRYECGWVTSLDPHDIADTIKRAIQEFKLAPLNLRQNAQNVSRDFTWDNIGKDSITKYIQAISHNKIIN